MTLVDPDLSDAEFLKQYIELTVQQGDKHGWEVAKANLQNLLEGRSLANLLTQSQRLDTAEAVLRDIATGPGVARALRRQAKKYLRGRRPRIIALLEHLQAKIKLLSGVGYIPQPEYTVTKYGRADDPPIPHFDINYECGCDIRGIGDNVLKICPQHGKPLARKDMHDPTTTPRTHRSHQSV